MDAVARAIICGKPEMKIGEIAIVAALKSELPPVTLWPSELATCSPQTLRRSQKLVLKVLR